MAESTTMNPSFSIDLPDAEALRPDLKLIAQMIEPDTRVLDIGCETGDLLHYLAHHRNVDGRGMELSQEGVNACVAKGLSVVQGDADRDLFIYPDGVFDYVILSRTLQATRQPLTVVRELCRIGRRAIVSFPNFGHWKVRLALALGGRMPVTESLPVAWYETPNIHLCTTLDFIEMVERAGLRIEKAVTLSADGKALSGAGTGWLSNLMGEQALFVLAGKD